MRRPRPTRLRPLPGAPAADARIIDADYREVGGRRRSFVSRLGLALRSIFWAALIGFMLPPAILIARTLAELFAG